MGVAQASDDISDSIGTDDSFLISDVSSDVDDLSPVFSDVSDNLESDSSNNIDLSSSDYSEESDIGVSDSNCNKNVAKLGDSNQDDSNTLKPSAKTFDAIQETINNAKSEDTIELNGTYTGSGKQITITKDLTIIGVNNAVLDAKKLSRIFFINPSNVTLKNIKFTNAYLEESEDLYGDCGGAIYQNGGLLSIYNCSFVNNYADYDGGAISSIHNPDVKNNHLNVIGCIFEYNSASRGSSISNGINSSIDSSVFRNNKDKYYGTIENLDYIFINNCSFIKNNMAISSDMDLGAYIQNSEFINNTHKWGASIYVLDGLVTVKNCTFKNNFEAAIITDFGIVKIVKSNGTITYKKGTSLNNDLNKFSLLIYKKGKTTTTYNSGKAFTLKCTLGNSKKAFSAMYIILFVYSGKKLVNEYYAKTNSKGIARFKSISRLNAGKYTLKVSLDGLFFPRISSTFKVYKAPTVVKAPKVTNKFKKSKYFKVTVKNKVTKKAVNGLKLKLKVYTGKKYKIYNVKTNKKGVAKFNTKKLKKGKHKVVISTKNKNYKLSKKSVIKIK